MTLGLLWLVRLWGLWALVFNLDSEWENLTFFGVIYWFYLRKLDFLGDPVVEAEN